MRKLFLCCFVLAFLCSCAQEVQKEKIPFTFTPERKLRCITFVCPVQKLNKQRAAMPCELLTRCSQPFVYSFFIGQQQILHSRPFV